MCARAQVEELQQQLAAQQAARAVQESAASVAALKQAATSK